MNRQEINSSLSRVSIRGKEYVDVASRIQGFWQLYPEGSITTKLLSDDGKRCVFLAQCLDANGRILSTGHAYEIQGRGVNATSYLENCETSAVGRALGMFGIGSTESIASAEEVSNAVAQQEQAHKQPQRQQQKPQPNQAQAFKRLEAACAAYEQAHPQDDKEPGWAINGVKQRPDLPPKSAPDAERAEWFTMVAYEFESSL